MADFLLHHILSLITVFSLTFPATGALSDSIQTTPFKLGTEKLSHFMFYWHDIHSGSKPTSIKILKPLAKNVSLVTGFGTLSMIDDPLTEDPENDSKMIGRAQGFYGMASQEEVGLIMVMNFMFVMGRYNGSTLTVVGRNPVFQKVREMPVIGGTGLFRFARGYVQVRTHTLNTQTGDAIVEYDVYVLHY